MADLKLTVLSLRYSSWSMRPWLALTHAGADFVTETVELTSFSAPMSERRRLGSVAGLFPVLHVDDTPIHESLAIVEFVADTFPGACLWPEAAVDRARARAICAELVGGFRAIRSTMSCHLFARVPAFTPDDATSREIDRVFEIWTDCLHRSGGPFLFGTISNADFFYYPVLTRFRTYGVELPGHLDEFAASVEAHRSVRDLIVSARDAPRNRVYDDYIEGLGGDPNATLS